MIPDPLLKSIQTNRCLLFIGAGFSKNAILPEGKSMPDWKELAIELSKDLEHPTNDPLQAASDYAQKFGKNELISKLSELLHIENAKPGKAHEKLSTIIAFDTIVTTNFEYLLEQSYSDKKHPQVIVGDEHIGKYSPSTHTNIIKIHGDFSHYRDIVVTQEDYTAFLKLHPILSTNLAAWFSTKTPLFIGYSLNDPHFQQIRHILREQLGEFMNKGYIVLFDVDSNTIQDFENEHLYVINLQTNGSSKEKVLLEFLCQIQDYVSVKDVDYSSSVQESTEKLNQKIISSDAMHSQSGKIIDIFSKFEVSLRHVLRDYGVEEEQLNRSSQYLIKTAAQNGLLAPFEVGELTRIREIRNNVVHSKYLPTSTETDYVENILKNILERFSEVKPHYDKIILDVSTNKTIFTDDNILEISGHVNPIIPHIAVSLIIKNPKNQLVSISQLAVNPLGNFQTQLITGGNLWIESGTYIISVQYGHIKNQKTIAITFLKKLLPVMLPYPIKINEKKSYFSYSITGGNLKSAFPDLAVNSLILQLTSFSNGDLSITLPRKLIDAKTNDKDDVFFVLVDGMEVSFEEISSNIDRKLIISFPFGTHEIEIIGTQIGDTIKRQSSTVEILHGSSSPRDDEHYLQPQTLIIDKDQTVTWINCDDAAHTVTSGTPENGSDGKFDSSLFMSGLSFSYKFDKKGTYRYYCLVHPWKEGKIIVK